MHIPPQYAYLVTTVLFFVFWLILYISRRDLRKEMWFMSIFIAASGLVAEYLFWTVDWWRPLTVTGTRVGVEDLLLGFTNGGIAAVLYEEVFKQKLSERKTVTPGFGIFFLIPLTFMILAGGVWWLHLTSFWATTVALLIIGIVVIIVRRDLWQDALTSGFLVAFLVLPFFWVFMFLSPGIIEKTWLFDHLSGIRVIGVPLEDIIFYFLVGFVVGPFYEYWQGKRLRKTRGVI